MPQQGRQGKSMAYVISRLCIDCLDKGCVEVCPVECIYEVKAGGIDQLPNMLYIHPTECISCSACEPECPWGAIFEDRELPALFQADVEINARCEKEPSKFQVGQPHRDTEGRLLKAKRPDKALVTANRLKWQP